MPGYGRFGNPGEVRKLLQSGVKLRSQLNTDDVFTHASTLQEVMMFEFRTKVFGWKAGEDGSAFYRTSEPVRNLDPSVFIGHSSMQMPGDWVDYDVIHAQRVSRNDEEAQPVDRWIQVCLDMDILSIYDIDDNFFALPEYNPAANFFRQTGVLKNVKGCAEIADICTVSTEPLGHVMRKINPCTVVLPNYIDESVLNIERSDHGDFVLVGWSGSATHDADFAMVKPQLFNMLFSNPQTRFAVIGSDYASDLPPDRVAKLPWTKSTRKLYPKIAQFDIGIAPLVNDEFNESKSYIKALEYAALGIPCVVSNVPAYQDFVLHEKTGFLADSPMEFADALQALIADPDLRADMGQNAREYARNFTIQANIHKYERLYLQ